MLKKIIILILSIASAGLFLSGETPQPMLLLFSLFLFVLAFEKPLQKINSWIRIPLVAKLIILMVLSGLITEVLAIWNTSFLSAEHAAAANSLYSANPLLDVIIGWGYYIPLAIVWSYLLKKYSYSTRDVFISMGLFGIFFEGQFTAFLSFNPLVWLYAFLVHGSYLTMAYLIVKHDRALIERSPKIISAPKKYFYGVLATIVLTSIPLIIWTNIVNALAGA